MPKWRTMKLNKQIGMTVFNCVLIVAAYSYLIYTFVTFPNYSDLAAHFRGAGWAQLLLVVAAACLMPLNIFCEACKWRYLLRRLEPMSLVEAQKQVYRGFVGAMLTPERLGDYPTRVTRIDDTRKWLPAITLGFAGTMALSSVNILCGVCSVLFTGVEVSSDNRTYMLAMSLMMLVLFVGCVLALPAVARWLDGRREYKPTWQKMIDVMKDFSLWEFPVLIGWSFCRYVVYATQLLLVLLFCGVELTPLQFLIVIPVHYLFVTVVPTVPVADAAVRGSVACIIFGAYTANTAGVAIAMIILWLINTIAPVLVGTLIKKK